MERDPSGCTLPDRERLILAYLDGTIADTEAESFEAHCMTCDDCSTELERGVEIRAAVSSGARRTPSMMTRQSPTRKFDWRWLAAAAGIVLVASIWQLDRAHAPAPADLSPTPAPPVTPTTPAALPSPAELHATRTSPTPPAAGANRSTTNSQKLRTPSQADFHPKGERGQDGGIRLTWTALNRADHYVVTVFAGSGRQLFQAETLTPEFQIPVATPELRGYADETLFARVEAIDALGATLASKDRIPIPARRDEPRK